jgi:F0F1-type ATP synthase delta subunit
LRINKLSQELREISQILRQPNEMPSTQTLRKLGHNQLIQAIRKKHGGFVQVAEKLSWEKHDNKAIEMQEKIYARTLRRKKRHQRIAKHNFF